MVPYAWRFKTGCSRSGAALQGPLILITAAVRAPSNRYQTERETLMKTNECPATAKLMARKGAIHKSDVHIDAFCIQPNLTFCMPKGHKKQGISINYIELTLKCWVILYKSQGFSALVCLKTLYDFKIALNLSIIFCK